MDGRNLASPGLKHFFNHGIYHVSSGAGFRNHPADFNDNDRLLRTQRVGVTEELVVVHGLELDRVDLGIPGS